MLLCSLCVRPFPWSCCAGLQWLVISTAVWDSPARYDVRKDTRESEPILPRS